MTLKLDIIVTGAGICGLASALALCRAGHNVTVYEKYRPNVEAGAGIVVSPNGVRVLRQFGLDPENVYMLKVVSGDIVNGETLQPIIPNYIEHEREKYGEWRYMSTRRDLRRLLEQAINDQAGKNGNGVVNILYNEEVIAYDSDKPAIMLMNSQWVTADIIIACDGIKSKAIEAVLGFSNPARPTGLSSFRLLVPAADLLKSQLVREHYQKGSGRIAFNVDRHSRFFVWWQCGKDEESHCIDMVVPDNDEYASTEEWFAKCDKSIILKEFQDFHPVFHDIINLADNPSIWKICNRDPLPNLHRGRLCILGDSLHPVPPFKGQGGSSSLEDAGSLELCFSSMDSRDEIPDRMQVLEELRKPRYMAIQLASEIRHDDPDLKQRWVKFLEDCRKIPGIDHEHLVDKAAFEAWLLRYDSQDTAREAVASMKRKKACTNGHST